MSDDPEQTIMLTYIAAMTDERLSPSKRIEVAALLIAHIQARIVDLELLRETNGRQ